MNLSYQALYKCVERVPQNAGVYQYFDSKERLLYVGKAKNLKNRVRSYFKFTPDFRLNQTLSPRIVKMLQEAHTLEYIIVDSEEDALILENSLIKQLNPKYNILLRDDKTYPYIYIDESQKYPRFEITRKLIKGKHITYYGPFPTSGRVLLDALYELYALVQKKSCLREGKACLFYQIGKCLAPCEEKISPNEYSLIIQEVKEAINKRKILIDKLQKKMYTFAEQERFEEAAKMRDIFQAIQSLTIASQVDVAKDIDMDIFAILNGDQRGVVVKLFMRAGKIISSSYNYFRHTHMYDTNEAYKQALLEFYSVDIPYLSQLIITAHGFEDSAQVAQMLSRRLGKKIEITTPQKGSKAKLVKIALENAKELLRTKKSENIIEQQIADLFSLSTIPYRIECFDNSHLMGNATVGAMVVYDEERWDKSSYRRYELHQSDEYGQMKELLSRRIADFGTLSAPDLWVLDGGQANLNLAQKLLEESKIHLDVIAISKEKLDAKAHRAKGAARDILYTPQGIFELQTTDKRLQWVQKLRDEAHRFAITYHQQKRQKEDTQISLLNKKGIGKATVKKLIDYFGTFEAIYQADIDQIALVVGIKNAKIIKDQEN